MRIDRQARAVAVKQGGVILRSQALDLGFTIEQIRHRLAVSDWIRLTDGSYRVLDMREPQHRLRAAVVVLPGAVVSHQSAGEIHGFPRVPEGHAVVMVHASTTHVLEGVTVHRTRDLRADHVVSLGELPVTSRERTIVDLAGVLHRRHLAELVDDCLAGGYVTLHGLAATFEVVGRRGKKGTAALRAIIDDRLGDTAVSGSAMERRAMALLLAAGLPRPRVEFPFPWDAGRRFDMAYPDRKVAIEWDSRRWHTRYEDFDRDRHRDREAIVHGWVVLRFTWDDLDRRPHEIVDVLRRVVDGSTGPISATVG